MKLQSTSLCALSTVILAALMLPSVPVHAQEADRTDFDLICTGLGERLESHYRYGYEWDPEKHKYVDHSGYQYDRTQKEASVQVEIHDGQGRIRPAKQMLPPLAGGGHDGWWTLHDLNITSDRIQASYRLNSMNNPKVDIDRHTGHVRIKGVETFEGNCTAVDPDKNQF